MTVGVLTSVTQVGGGVCVCSGTDVAVAVGGLIVFVGADVRVAVGTGMSGFSRVGVGVFVTVETALNVTTATGPGVAVSLPVTGKKRRPDGLGTTSASISFARTTAVLFRLAKDKSSVLRACRSMAVGGVGSMLFSTNTIHAMPAQSRRNAKA